MNISILSKTKRKGKRQLYKRKDNGIELQQPTLESIVERCKSYSADHPRAKAIINCVSYWSTTLPHCTSERLFSSASDIVSTERNRLLPEKAEMLLFIKKNLPVQVKGWVCRFASCYWEVCFNNFFAFAYIVYAYSHKLLCM